MQKTGISDHSDVQYYEEYGNINLLLIHDRFCTSFLYFIRYQLSVRVDLQVRLIYGPENNQYRKYNSSLGQVLRNYVCNIP